MVKKEHGESSFNLQIFLLIYSVTFKAILKSKQFGLHFFLFWKNVDYFLISRNTAYVTC